MSIDWSRVVTVSDDETVNVIAGKSILYVYSVSGSAYTEWGDISGTLSDQTDLQNALNAKANSTSLGTMASKNDAPSDSKTYGRKNGAWTEVTGGGGGSATVRRQVTNPFRVVLDQGSIVCRVRMDIFVRQTGSGTPSSSNIRPFLETKRIQLISYDGSTLKNNFIINMVDANNQAIYVYGGYYESTGNLYITHEHIASYAGETLPGVWWSDREEYEPGTTPTTGAEVVYELDTPVRIQNVSAYYKEFTSEYAGVPKIEGYREGETILRSADSITVSAEIEVSLDEYNDQIIAPVYTDDNVYEVGDCVMYHGGLFRFVNRHFASLGWRETDVTPTTVMEEIMRRTS